LKHRKKHHENRLFMEEYPEFLKSFEIEYDEKPAFKPVE
jgi:hypothetical protein